MLGILQILIVLNVLNVKSLPTYLLPNLYHKYFLKSMNCNSDSYKLTFKIYEKHIILAD